MLERQVIPQHREATGIGERRQRRAGCGRTEMAAKRSRQGTGAGESKELRLLGSESGNWHFMTTENAVLIRMNNSGPYSLTNYL